MRYCKFLYIIILLITINEISFSQISIDSTSRKKNIQQQSGRKYGILKISKQDQILYSGAYTNYASFFQNNPYNVEFDTLLFDQRFDNPEYKRLVRNNTFVSSYFLKPLSKQYKKNICFNLIDIKRSGNSLSYIYNNFPEYNSLKPLVWVMDIPIKRKEFYKMYKKRSWHDFRLAFNDVNNTFTLIFKDDTSFFSINAKPLMPYNMEKPNYSIENFHKIFLTYEKKLDKRREAFNKKLIKDYTIFKNAKQRFSDSCWVAFSRMFLSDEEKKMNRDEWYEYYENIIANEKKILNQAVTNQKILVRALQLIGFKGNVSTFNTSLIKVSFKLVDNENKVLSVNNATIIDLQNLNFENFLGGLGYNETSLFLKPDGRYVIYAELIGGDIAIVKPGEIIFNSDNIYSNMLYKTTIIEKELNSLEQILNYFNLKL